MAFDQSKGASGVEKTLPSGVLANLFPAAQMIVLLSATQQRRHDLDGRLCPSRLVTSRSEHLRAEET
jgi:hypothetical protein